MPKAKTRISKAGLSKKKTFQFRWWMGVLMAVIIAVVGIVVIRFSHASGSRTFSVDAGSLGGGNGAQAYPIVNGRGYTAYNNAILVENGGYAQAGEGYQDIVSTNPANVQSATIRTCWVFYRYASNGPANYTIEMLDWGGNQIAVAPDVMYGTGTVQKCIDKTINSPGSNYSYFYKFVGTNSESIAVVAVTRSTLQVVGSAQNNPSPPPPPPVGGIPPSNYQTLSFPAGTLTTTCGYQNYKGYASVCPQNSGQWQYTGLNSAWVGTWQQNQARGVTHEHDVGYWRWGNFCAVKSHVVSDPSLPKVDESNGVVHFYLVGCPTTSDFYNFKRSSNSGGWSSGSGSSSYPNGCWINGKLETSPDSCKKVANRGGNVVPR